MRRQLQSLVAGPNGTRFNNEKLGIEFYAMPQGATMKTTGILRDALSLDHAKIEDGSWGEGRMQDSILFACTANVCRSPLMHYTFTHEIEGHRPWIINSAGTNEQSGSPMCAASLALVPAGSRGKAAAHTSSALGDAPLNATLIIVASRKERAMIARKFPEVRPRLFTLTEAVALGRLARSRPSFALEAHETASGMARLIDAQRGSIAISRTERQSRLLPGSKKTHPFDIPDGHHASGFSHRKYLKRVRRETIELAEIVNELQAI